MMLMFTDAMPRKQLFSVLHYAADDRVYSVHKHDSMQKFSRNLRCHGRLFDVQVSHAATKVRHPLPSHVPLTDKNRALGGIIVQLYAGPPC